jgi:hypothetical protein
VTADRLVEDPPVTVVQTKSDGRPVAVAVALGEGEGEGDGDGEGLADALDVGVGLDEGLDVGLPVTLQAMSSGRSGAAITRR